MRAGGALFIWGGEGGRSAKRASPRPATNAQARRGNGRGERDTDGTSARAQKGSGKGGGSGRVVAARGAKAALR